MKAKVYELKKVHIVNLICIYFISILLTVIGISSVGMSAGIKFIIESLSVCGVLTAMFFIPIKDSIKGFVFALVPAIIATISFLTNSPFLLGYHYMIFLSIAMIALYFNRLLILIFGVVVNALILVVYALALNNLFAGQYTNVGSIISLLLYINTIIGILYFLTKWGRELVNVSIEEGIKTKNLLDKLETTMENININTTVLNKDIKDSYIQLEEVRETSMGIVSTVQEVAKGVVEQAESLSQISEMMNEANGKVSEVNNSAKQLALVSNDASKVVLEGSEKICNMDKQMIIINSSVTDSLLTVQELQTNMDEVNKFLSSIMQVADQTNLLALNAAIEAARAGELGKGFAVVADEVGKLAEQSANTVKQINKVMNVIKDKTKNVFDKVQNGNTATIEGVAIVNEVNESFQKIKESFKAVDSVVLNELKMIENTTEIFSNIRGESENIASISEENSASTEEMLASMQEQNACIESIYNSMQNINEASENLKGMIQKN